MIKGGTKSKKTVEKKVPKKVNLTVKVHNTPRKNAVKTPESKKDSALVFDRPEDIKKKKQENRKKIMSWTKKKKDNGFIQAEVAEKLEQTKDIQREKQSVKAEAEITQRSKSKVAAILSQKTEADKKLIMWSGVGFFMALIFIVWIFQVKYTISQTKLEDNNKSGQDLSLMMDDVSEKIRLMKGDLEKINSFNDVASSSSDIVVNNTTVATGTEAVQLPIASSTDLFATGTPVIASGSEDLIKAEVLELKERLEGVRD